MPDLPSEAQEVLYRWVRPRGQDIALHAEDFLALLVDSLKDKVQPIPTGGRGRPQNDPLLSLLVWAEVSRLQIVGRKPGYSTVLLELEGQKLPTGRVYQFDQLKRFYNAADDVLAGLNERLWLIQEVGAAIQEAEARDPEKPPYMARLNARVKQKGKRYRKKLESELAMMTDGERLEWSESVTLNALYHQLVLCGEGLFQEGLIQHLLLRLARIRSADFSAMSHEERQAWIDSVYLELGFERT